jgi:hypothetical protein
MPNSDIPICARSSTKNNILLMVAILRKVLGGGSIKRGISSSNCAVFTAINCALSSQTKKYPTIPITIEVIKRRLPETHESHRH